MYASDCVVVRRGGKLCQRSSVAATAWCSSALALCDSERERQESASESERGCARGLPSLWPGSMARRRRTATRWRAWPMHGQPPRPFEIGHQA